MKITENFDSKEFDCHDGTAYPKEFINSRLKPLCKALEVIRKALDGKSIAIDSGYRTRAYNAKIGGVLNSQHIQGKAADIKVDGFAPSYVAQTIRGLITSEKIPQGGVGEYKNFVHYDIRGTNVCWKG